MHMDCLFNAIIIIHLFVKIYLQPEIFGWPNEKGIFMSYRYLIYTSCAADLQWAKSSFLISETVQDFVLFLCLCDFLSGEVKVIEK